MEKAISQLEKFGEIRVTYYANRNYENGEQIVFKSITELNDFIHFAMGIDDDIHIPHANYF